MLIETDYIHREKKSYFQVGGESMQSVVKVLEGNLVPIPSQARNIPQRVQNHPNHSHLK